MMNDNRADILARLNAMLEQEKTTSSSCCCHDYFHTIEYECTTNTNTDVNESCHKAMVTWLQQVQKALSLNPETVWIAMSFFDRYLSINSNSQQAQILNSKRQFQLAAITSFYTAVKIYEPVVLGMDMLVEVICRGTYTQAEIIAMEHQILSVLEWRVSGHTPMDFVRHVLELLAFEQCDSDGILQACQKHLDHAVTDIYFSSCKPSVLGISCLTSALADMNIEECGDTTTISFSSEKQHTMMLDQVVSELCQFDDFDNDQISSSLSPSKEEIIMVQQHLLSACNGNGSSPACCNKRSDGVVSKGVARRTSLSSQTNTYNGVATDNVASSPVCIMQTARQA